MTLKKRSSGTTVTTFEKAREIRSGSQSSPLLTPLALLLLGAVQMARAQAEQAQAALPVADAPSGNPQGELFADADQPVQAPAGSAGVSEAAPAELLALLQSLADSARESADALVQDSGEGAAPLSLAGEPAAVAQATVDRIGQLDRAEAVLEAYQNVINQLPADLVLAQAPAAAAGAEAAGTAGAAGSAGAAAAAAGGVSAGTLLAGLLGLAAIGAGGGGGGGGTTGSNPAPAATTDITLHDGYISGAKVYVDLNDNGVVDLTGPNADKYLGQTVNGKLSAVLTDADKLHSLIALGGKDISTGTDFLGSFSTTAGSTVINPLSTLVQSLVQATVDAFQGKNLSASEKEAEVARAKSTAMAAVSTALGIDSDVDLTKLDTVGASSGKSSPGTTEIVVGFDEADAIALHSKALMVANLISMGTAAMASAAAASGDSTSGVADFSKYVVQGILNSVKSAASNGESVSFGTSESVKGMLDNAVSAARDAGKTLDNATVDNASSKVAGAVSTTNQLIGAYAADAAKAVAAPGGTSASATTGLTQMLQVQKAVADQAGGLSKGDSDALTKVADLGDTQKALDAAKSVSGLKIGTESVNSVALVSSSDSTPPTVSSIDIRPAREGDLAQIVVKMSEAVLIKPGSEGLLPALSITTSAAGASQTVSASAVLDPGLSAGDTVVFTYRVQAGDSRLAVADGASINVPAGASIKDLAGNAANPAIASGKAVVVDSIAPTVAISSDAAFVKAGATATVTFTLSEAPSTRTAGAFTPEDVTVKNGTLSSFTKVSDTVYTAKLAATSASAPAEVSISGGKFTDAAGNGNMPSNVVLLAQEGAAPVVAISAQQSFFNSINSQGTPTTTLKFSLSAASSDFTASDVKVTGGGELTGFTGTGKDYAATLTGVTAQTKVVVDKEAFSVTGTTAKSLESNSLTFKVDTSKPTVSIQMLKGASGTDVVTSQTTLKADDTARVIFTLSEEVQGFGPQSVKVMGGYLENFAQDKTDGKKFTAVFKPAPPEAGQMAAVDASISVDAKRFSDLAGNPNDAAQLASFKVDNIRPLVTLLTDDTAGTARSGAAVTYTYQFNKAVSGLAADDFTATNGSIVEVQPDPMSLVLGSGASSSVYTKWTVKVMPTDGLVSGNIGLVLKAGAVTDAAGNANQEHRQNVQAVDTLAPTAVLELDRATYLKASANGGNAMTGNLTIKFSEAVATLPGNALSVSGAGGTITGLSKVGDGKQWTAVFTPTEASAAGEVKIQLAAGFQDAAGNPGAAAQSAALRTNVVAPVLTLTADKTALQASETATLTFRFSEDVTGFDASDVTVTGGTLGTLTKVSNSQWTAVFTPTASSTPTQPGIAVADGKFASSTASIDGIGQSIKLNANLSNPTLTIALQSSKTGGILVYGVDVSDPNVTGLTTSDFSATNANVVANSLTPVPNASGKYTLDVQVTSAGSVVVSAPAGAGTALLPTAAAQSPAVNAILGTSGNDTLNLTSAKDVVIIGPTGGNDTVVLAEPAHSPAGLRDVILGVTAGDKLDISSLFNKSGTQRGYVGEVDAKNYTGPVVANWMTSVNKTSAGALGTPGDNELQYMQKTEGSTLTLSFTYDADSRVGSVDVQTVEVRMAAVDTATLDAFMNTDYAVLDKIAPTMTVAMEGGKTVFAKTNPGTAKVIFTSSEIVDSLDSSAIAVTGGSLTAPVRSASNPAQWTATFTPSSDANVTSGSIAVKAGSYADNSGNQGTVSNSVNLSINSNAPTVTLALDKVSAAGDIVYSVQASDAAVTGLAANDFSAVNGTVVAGSFAPVSGQAGKYNITVTPTATGDVKLQAAADAGVSGSLGTQAAESAAIKVVKGTSANETFNLADGRVIVLGDGNDTVKINATADSSAASMATVAGVSGGDKFDITALLNKAGTQAQYFTLVDNSFPGALPSGWIKAIDRTNAADLGTVGDNELRYKEVVQDNVMTLSFAFDADSRAGSTSLSDPVQTRWVAADAASLSAFRQGASSTGYVVAEKVAPTISVAMEGGKTSFTKNNPGTATVVFTTSEPIAALPSSSVTVAGGTITAPSQAGALTWTSTFTPSADASVKSGSISVKDGAYADYQGNTGSASSALSLTLNVQGANLSLSRVDTTSAGQMVFKLVSDLTLTGLEAADFNGSGYTVNSLTPVSGSGGKEFLVNILPTASGTLSLALPAGAATANSLPTPAVNASPASVQVSLATGLGGDIAVSGPAERLIVMGAGTDVIKVTGVGSGSGVSNMGLVAGIGIGDKLDISSVIKAAGYQSLAVADSPDPADAFVVINNVVVVPDSATNTTAVTFDVVLDASTINGSRINGFSLDLAYDASSLEYTVDPGTGDKTYSFYTSPKTYEVTVNRKVTTVDVLDLIVANPENGKITASNSKQTVFNTQDIADVNGKLLTIDLTLTKLVNSFQVGFDAGSGNSLTLLSGTAPALVVGSAKTGYAGGASGVQAGALNVSGTESNSSSANPATPGDNQLRYLEIVDPAGGSTGALKFQFDTDPSVGKVALSPVVVTNLIATDLTAFFNSDYVKPI